MLTYISSWFFSPVEDEIVVTEEQKRNRYEVLKEIKQFDKTILLPVPQSIEEFTNQPKKKLFTFKRKRKRNRKKSNNK